jgi:hypothetical protein
VVSANIAAAVSAPAVRARRHRIRNADELDSADRVDDPDRVDGCGRHLVAERLNAVEFDSTDADEPAAADQSTDADATRHVLQPDELNVTVELDSTDADESSAPDQSTDPDATNQYDCSDHHDDLTSRYITQLGQRHFFDPV